MTTMVQRDKSIDILRSLAIIFMVASHVVWFLSNEQNAFWIFIRNFGDTICFVTFLFVFGISSYFSIFSKELTKETKTKLLKRIGFLLIAYYIIAYSGVLKELTQGFNLSLIFKVLVFYEVPGFTEFMLPFVFYSLIFYFSLQSKALYNLVKRINLPFVLIASIVLYIIGNLIFSFNNTYNNTPATHYISILSGGGGLLRFSLLHYSPSLLLGLYVGKLIKELNEFSVNKKLFKYSLIISVITVALWLSERFVDIEKINQFLRWPPSVLFILCGLSFSLITLTVTRFKELKVYKYLSIVGTSSVSILVLHIVFLNLTKLFNFTKTDNFFVLLISFILLFGISSVLSIRKNMSQAETQVNKKRSRYYIHFLTSLILLLITASIIITLNTFGWSVFPNSDKQLQHNPDSIPISKPEPIRTPNWWKEEYSYNKNISISNTSNFRTIGKGDLVQITLNHAELVTQGKSNASGSDIRIVYLDENSDYQNVIPYLTELNTDHTQVSFNLYESIDAGRSNPYYYIYYDSTYDIERLIKKPVIEKFADKNLYTTTLSNENQNPFRLSLSRKWILKGDEAVDAEYKNVEAKVDSSLNNISQTSLDIYNRKETLLSTYKLTDEGTKLKVDLSMYDPGEYYAQLKGIAGEKSLISPKQKFMVSYPLYVNWSIDWEGYDVEDKSIKSIETISNTFKVPITHYFNPRIYLPTQNKEKAKKWTDWIKKRYSNKGDEISLHLHMWYDMVEYLGIPVKKEPQWDNQNSGHDVPQTVYSKEEFDQMIKWALNEFRNNGLPEPKGYRAGGWQINIDQLKILKENNFLYDSSARNHIEFGKNKVPVPWNLTSTTKPYKPSIYDMNKAGDINIGIWEFPNNGDNSSNYGQNSTVVLNRFKDNFKNTFLEDKQTFVFLSHAQGFYSSDEKVVNSFFNEVKKYNAETDGGPIIYTTVEKVLREYEGS